MHMYVQFLMHHISRSWSILKFACAVLSCVYADTLCSRCILQSMHPLLRVCSSTSGLILLLNQTDHFFLLVETTSIDKRRVLAESSSPDKRRGVAADKGLARTKSLAPIAASKSLVKWSSKEASAGQAKNPLQMRASRESSVMSESPRSSVTGGFCHAFAGFFCLAFPLPLPCPSFATPGSCLPSLCLALP